MDSRCDSIGDLSPRSAPPEHGLPWSCSRPATLLGAALVVLAGLGAYANSFCGPFIFDDRTSILDNPSIRQWLSVKQVLSPPHDGQTVSGRPLLNASLAVNYAIGQGRPWGYHVTNLAIHLANALLLLGIVRRTLLLPAIRPRFGDASLGLAVAVALWWVVHPLQTESVTYVVQRGRVAGRDVLPAHAVRSASRGPGEPKGALVCGRGGSLLAGNGHKGDRVHGSADRAVV